MTLKISISGIRGISNQSLTPQVCMDFARSFGTYTDGGQIVIGSDTRASSEFIKGIVLQGLISTGCKVIDLGVCPTPTVGLMVRETKAAGGVIITASHNPPEWNGLKFIRPDGIFLNQAEGQTLLDIYQAKSFKERTGGSCESCANAGDIHIKRILAHVNVSAINAKNFKVVIDSVNGAGSFITPILLKKLGCKVIELNCAPDGAFPRGAEPTPENTKDLQKMVKEHKADIGFAQDPDADRLAIVTEEGSAVSEEYTLALCVKHMLARNGFSGKKIIVTNLSTSQVIDDIAKSAGAIVMRTRIGEAYVAEEIKKENALIGGEGNGGVIFPKICYNRDSLIGIALILELMAKAKKPISKILQELPFYYIDKKKLACASQEEADRVIETTKDLYRERTLDLTEGVKVLFKNGWLHIRASNTEPIVRIFAEAVSQEEAQKMTGDFLAKLNR